jgi:hypothetical protein
VGLGELSAKADMEAMEKQWKGGEESVVEEGPFSM